MKETFKEEKGMKFKKVISVITAAALVLGMSGCGGSTGKPEESGKAQESKTASSEVVEVTIPTYLAGENVGAKFFLPEVERFNKNMKENIRLTLRRYHRHLMQKRLNSWHSKRSFRH